MATNFADLLARLQQGDFQSQQRASFPNFTIPTFQPRSPAATGFTQGAQLSNSIAPAFNFSGFGGFDDTVTTGEDQPDDAPGIGVPDLEGTLGNFAGVVSTLLSATNPIGMMGILSAAALNPGAEFDHLGAPGFRSAFNGLFGNPEVDFFDFDPSVGPNPSPGEFESFEPGVAYSSLGYGETDFGTGFSSRDVEGLEDGVGVGATAANNAGLAAAIDESFDPDFDLSEVTGPDSTENDNDAGPDSDSVICTELNSLGLLSDAVYKGDDRYGRKLSPTTMKGYHWWGKPFVRLMRRSKRALWWATALGVPCATEMAYRGGYVQKGSLFGHILLTFGIPVCWIIGQTIRFRRRLDILPVCKPCHRVDDFLADQDAQSDWSPATGQKNADQNYG